MPAEREARLKEGIGLAGIVSLGAGTAIGVAIFSIIAPGAKLAGPGMLLSMLIAGVPMIVFAVTYAFMGSADPVSGASYEWSRRYVHPFVGFFIGWLRIGSNVAAIVLYAYVLVQYWSMVVALPPRPVMFALLAFFYVLNMRGVTVAAHGQALMMFVLLATCALLVIFSVPAIEPANYGPLRGAGMGGVLAAVPLMVSLFLGIETATEVGEEIKDNRRIIPLGIALSVITTAAFYFLVAAAALGVLGAGRLAASDAPLLALADTVMGRYGRPLILAAATFAIGTSLNATSMIFSRFLYAMGRSGILPTALARVHPRWRTPHVATTVVFVLCALGCLMPLNLIFLFLAVNIPTLLKYGATSLAATRVVDRHPEIHAGASFHPRPAALKAWAFAGIVCALVLLVLGMTADWRPYVVLAAWAVVGLIYYPLRRRSAVRPGG